MTRRHLTWAYLGNNAGSPADLAQSALDNPELNFMFANSEDKSRVRRQIEAALRTSATDREILETAVRLGVRL